MPTRSRPVKIYDKPIQLYPTKGKANKALTNVKTFYTVADGYWHDVSTWSTIESGNIGRLPTEYETVFIKHHIYIASPLTIRGNCYIKGILHLVIGGTNTPGLDIYGEMYSKTGRLLNYGCINIYAVSGGLDNMENDTYQDFGIVVFRVSQLSQMISKAVYNNVYLSSPNTSGPYPLYLNFHPDKSYTFKGTILAYGFDSGYPVVLRKTGIGFIIFGYLGQGYARQLLIEGVSNLEFRDSIDFSSNLLGTGTGTWRFTTNNSYINGASLSNGLMYPKLVVENIDLTISGSVFSDQEIIGTTSGSKLIIGGRLWLYNAAYPIPMVGMGILDYMTTYPTAEIGYMFGGAAYALPYTAYGSLAVGGSQKNLSGNTTTNGTFLIWNSGLLDCLTYNMSIGSNTIVYDGATFIKSTAGSMLFIGYLYIRGTIAFTGNPTVELRGGILHGGSPNVVNMGTGIWTFTTNNQNIWSEGFSIVDYPATFIISGAITVTALNVTSTTYIFSGSINGNNAGSTLVNQMVTGFGGGFVGIHYRGTTQPMDTGILDCNSAANVWFYDRSGNQDVKGTTYRILEFGGSGVKRLMGNVIVNTTAGGSWSITGTATIDYNGFSITTI